MSITIMAARCEYQICADSNSNPGLCSLAFASRVNLGQPMALKRALRGGAGGEETDESISQAAICIHELLHTGAYEDALGRRVPVRGDISKTMTITGLKNTEKSLFTEISFHVKPHPWHETNQEFHSTHHLVQSHILRRSRLLDADAQRAALRCGYTTVSWPSL